ncbi:unnamed protein product [Spirodela intermedia]|uniref:non-specific serine/threonine protein kinase n=1 Tax=Spirodela intermedia TaxID=51605 RepID=A0A7I8JLK8_SPIIN|nr:unnamed protein product [Spirodela intermedia]CAA6670651.1 unnamed protein product [Spirodela intermedia]
MGCSFSGLNALYDANRFRILRQLGEGGFAYVFLVKEVIADDGSQGGAASGLAAKKLKNPSHVSDEGLYAMKKVLIQTEEQLELVRQEIRVSSLFSHPNLLPLLDHAIIGVKGGPEKSRNHEAYLLFPVHLDGTLLDSTKAMQSKKGVFPHTHRTSDLQTGTAPLAILMDFGSATPAKKEIRSRSEALQLQEWAAEHCSAPFRAPELWDCPSHADIDERTDIWSLGCTLYATMYGVSPFEHVLGESGGSLQLAVMNAQVKWPAGGPDPPYPEQLRQFVVWLLQPQPTVRPRIDDVILHVDKLMAKFSSE